MRREIKSQPFFYSSQRREQEGRRGKQEEEARTPPSITIIFSPPLDHDDHHSPLFGRLYLGPQPRYKPSAPSSLPPTPVAIDGCPPIIHLHHGLPLRRPFLPRHETNFIVLPPSHSKPSLNAQPSSFSSPLSNSLKKRPRRFRGRKVSKCFVICIIVYKK